VSDFVYDAFASYATDPDTAVVRDVERFLESLHENPLIPREHRRKLEVCVDGSDFKVAGQRSDEVSEPVREIIIGYMRQCRRLVLFSGPKSATHEWVVFEVDWWIRNRGAASILLAVTHGDDIATLFPACVIGAGLHRSIWLDLRGYGRGAQPTRRPYEEERLRLAAALMDAAPAQLISGWRAEAARARRRRAITRSLVITAIVVLLVVAGYSLRRWRENARQARAAGWALLSQQIAAPQANRGLDRLAYALAAFREYRTVDSYTALQQAMAPLPVVVGAFRLPGGRGITAVRFLERDQVLFTTGHDGFAQLTLVATHAPIVRLRLSGRVYALAAHPERKWLAVATNRGVDLVEYTATTARVIMHLPAEAPVRAVEFDPSGRNLYTGDFAGRVTQYASERWTAVHAVTLLDQIGARVGVIGFVPTWRAKRLDVLAIQGERCTVDLAGWIAQCDAKRGNKVHALAAANGVAAAAEARGGVHVFRADTAETLAYIPPPPVDRKQVTTGIALSPDAKLVGVTAHDGTVRIYSIADRRLLNVAVGDAPARSFAFSESGRLLACGSDDGNVMLWNIAGDSSVWTVSGVRAAAADPVAQRLASLKGEALQIRDVPSGSLRSETAVPDTSRWIQAFTWTSDGSAVAARLDRSDRILVWRIARTLEGPAILQHSNEAGHVAVVSSLVAGPGLSELVTTESFQSKAISFWDAEAARLLARFPMDDEVFLAATGKDVIVAADKSGLVRLIRASDRKVTSTFRVKGTPSVLALDRDARSLFISWGAHACIYELDSPLTCRSILLEHTPTLARFSPRGRYLAIATDGGLRGGAVVVADGQKHWAVRQLASTSLAHHLAFSADENFIAAAHDQRGVSVFSTQNGERVADVPVGAQLKMIAVMPDAAQTLVTLTEDGVLQSWRWKPADVVKAACARWPPAYQPATLPGTAPIPLRAVLCSTWE